MAARKLSGEAQAAKNAGYRRLTIDVPGCVVLREPRRCAGGHLVVIWPCLQCRMAAAKQEALRKASA